MFDEQNELLRMAYQIACREGQDTNWPVFKKNLERELLKQNNIITAEDMQAVSKAMGIPEEQIILRATCTARTCRMPRELMELPFEENIPTDGPKIPEVS